MRETRLPLRQRFRSLPLHRYFCYPLCGHFDIEKDHEPKNSRNTKLNIRPLARHFLRHGLPVHARGQREALDDSHLYIGSRYLKPPAERSFLCVLLVPAGRLPVQPVQEVPTLRLHRDHGHDSVHLPTHVPHVLQQVLQPELLLCHSSSP